MTLSNEGALNIKGNLKNGFLIAADPLPWQVSIFKIIVKYFNTTLLLMGILVLSVVLRFYHLDFQSLWMDEIHSIRGSDPARSLESVLEYCRSDQPPAYFLMLYYCFKLFGYNELYGRVIAAVMGVAGVGAVYLLGKEISNEKSGLIAAFLTAINHFHIEYSQEARFYSLLFLASTLSFLFFIRAVKNGKNIDYLLYSLSTALALYTQYYGLVLAASQAFIFLALIALGYKKSKEFIIKSLLASVATLLFFLPWLPQIFADNAIESFWISPIKITFIIRYLFFYFGDNPVVTLISVGLICLYIVRLFKLFSDLQPVEKAIHVILIGWIVYGYVIPYLYSILKMPMLFPRYTLIVLPAIIMTIVLGIEKLAKPATQAAFLSVIGLAALVHLFFTSGYYSDTRKVQLRELSKEVADVNCSGCLILSDATWYYDYYFQKYHYNKAIKSHDPLLPEMIHGIDSVWLLGATTLLASKHDPELITKNYHLNWNIKGFYTFARLYTKQKAPKVTTKDLIKR